MLVLTALRHYSLRLIVLVIWLGVNLAAQRKIGRAYACVLMFIPALLGSILVSKLPGNNKVGLLFSYWISSMSSPSLPLGNVCSSKCRMFLSLSFSLRLRALRDPFGLG